MEENKNIINNEENNYDTVIIEDTDEVLYNEVVQVVQIDEPELFTVSTDSAFASLGEANEQLNHNLLHNRDSANQHIIESITGLREELDGIHALKTVESDKRGSANYYMWKDALLPGDWVGYFVSMHTERDPSSGSMLHKIRICNDKAEIFGVTVDSAGFVGGQEYNEEDKPRGDEYALVANTGVVKVKCEPDVIMGDYVMSNKYGEAAKSNNNKYGYYVISVDNVTNIADPTNIQRYAVISLDSTMNQVYTLSEDVISFNERVRNVEINTNAAINAATEALKNSEASINSALQNSQNALDNATSALDKVEDLENGFVEGIEGINDRVDAIDDAITIAALDAAREVVGELINDAVATNQDVKDLQEKVAEAQDTLNQSLIDMNMLAENIQPLVHFENGEHTGVAGVAASTKDNTVQIATISQCLSNDYTSVDTWGNSYGKDKGQIYYVKDERLYYYYDTTEKEWLSTPSPTEAGLSEAIAGVHQRVDEDEAMIDSLASYTGDKYISVYPWNRYVVIYDWEKYKHLADPYMIYFDSKTNSYWQCDLNNLENPWSKVNKPEGWDALTDDDIDKVYYGEDTERYYYYDHHWRSTVSSTAKMVASIALSKQYANSNEARINNIVSFSGEDGKALSEIQQLVNNHESKITSLTSYVENNYEKFDVPWDEVSDDKKELTENIYYAKDTDGVWKYWYYKEEDQEPGWVGSPNPSDAGLVASIVNVQQQASDNEASIAALQSWQGKTNDAIAKLESSAGEDGASMESLVMNISKYAVGKYSQAYGLTVAEAKDLLRDGTVFVPSEDTTEFYGKYIRLDDVWSENTDAKNQDLIYYAQKTQDEWKFWYWDINTQQWTDTDKTDAVQKRPFSKGFYYVWNKNDGVWYDGKGDVEFVTSYIVGSETTKYIVIEEEYKPLFLSLPSKNVGFAPMPYVVYYFEKEAEYGYYDFDRTWYPAQDPYFEIGALYKWDIEDELWKKVATLESNTLNRAISQMRQSVTDTESEFSVGLTNVKGDLVSVQAEVDGLGSKYVAQTVFENKMTSISQESDNNSAAINMLVSTGFISVESWDKEGKEEDKIYYDKATKNYHYYDSGDWIATPEISNPKIASKINSAGIITAINNDESSVKISGDKVSITADSIDLSGYVTINSLKSGGSTEIDGSRITTGSIQSTEYALDSKTGYASKGTEINLTNGSITSENFKIDSSGDVAANNLTLIGGVVQSTNYKADSAGTKIDLSNGSIDTKNFKVKSDGTVTIGGYLSADDVGSKGTTVIDGARISTGTISADRLAAGTITADKLNVGTATKDNLFANHRFGTVSESKALGWYEENGTLTPQKSGDVYNWAKFFPSSTAKSGFYQKFYLKKGRYSIIARMNFFKLSSIESNASLGYYLGATWYGVPAPTASVSNLGGEIVLKWVFDYKGDEGFGNVGFVQKGFKFQSGGYISIAWTSLYEADDEPATGRWCSNIYWVDGNTSRHLSNVNASTAKVEDFQTTKSPFFVEPNGSLGVISGTLGAMEFTKKSAIFTSNVYVLNELAGRTYSMIIDTPIGGVVEPDNFDINYPSTIDLGVKPSITIRSFDNNSYSFFSHSGFECNNGTNSSAMTGSGVTTTGTLKCSNCNCTSKEKYKNSIAEKMSVLDKIKSSKIYEYRLNNEDENHKRKTGFIVERETPEEIISDDGDGINLYSMASMNWKATQELLERLETLEERVKLNEGTAAS